MVNLSPTRSVKVKHLFSCLRIYGNSPTERISAEAAQLLADPEVFQSLSCIFNDLSFTEEIHKICRHYYESYVSGIKEVQNLIILLIPSMLESYLVHVHRATPCSITQPSPPHPSPPPAFTVGDSIQTTTGLDALSFLLLQFCQLAPNCVRSPELMHSAQLPLPTLRVSSIYHNTTDLNVIGARGTQINPSRSSSTSTATILSPSASSKFRSSPWGSSLDPPTQQCFEISSCLLRVYTNTIFYQLSADREGHGKEACADINTVISIRGFCSVIHRVTSLEERPRIRSSPCFLLNIVNCVDSLLFLLHFERDLQCSIGRKLAQLRPLLFNLLVSVNQFAVYNCFCSVILLSSAVRNRWIGRFRLLTNGQRPTSVDLSEATTKVTGSISLGSLSSSSSDAGELENFEVEVLPIVSSIGDHSSSAATGIAATDAVVSDLMPPRLFHKTSAITNASFRPESVPEDIPMSTKAPDHTHLKETIKLPVINENLQQLTRSSENISSVGKGAAESDAKNVRRAPISIKFWHQKV